MLTRILGTILFSVTFLQCSLQDVHVGVDLVTKLSNNLVQTAFEEFSGKSDNVVFSPFGLFSNLAMIMEASDGEAREEFLRVLNVSAEDTTNVRKGFKAYCDLFSKYSSEPEAAGSFNAASVAASFKLNSDYGELLRTHYCANISESLATNATVLEFSSIAGVMSHWKDYEKLAVYTFLSHRSVTPFKGRNGSLQPVPMIPQVGVFKAKRWENSLVVLLPLQSKLASLLLVVPDKAEDVEFIATKLPGHAIPSLVQSLPKQEMEIFLPQMTIVSKNFNFGPLFMRKGISKVFQEKQSGLDRVSSDPKANVVLRKVDQNAYFSTSFVAVNSVSGISSSIETHKRSKRDAKKVYVDQPFLFFILQKDTQLVLLAGRVESPGQVPH